MSQQQQQQQQQQQPALERYVLCGKGTAGKGGAITMGTMRPKEGFLEA